MYIKQNLAPQFIQQNIERAPRFGSAQRAIFTPNQPFYQGPIIYQNNQISETIRYNAPQKYVPTVQQPKQVDQGLIQQSRQNTLYTQLNQNSRAGSIQQQASQVDMIENLKNTPVIAPPFWNQQNQGILNSVVVPNVATYPVQKLMNNHPQNFMQQPQQQQLVNRNKIQNAQNGNNSPLIQYTRQHQIPNYPKDTNIQQNAVRNNNYLRKPAPTQIGIQQPFQQPIYMQLDFYKYEQPQNKQQNQIKFPSFEIQQYQQKTNPQFDFKAFQTSNEQNYSQHKVPVEQREHNPIDQKQSYLTYEFLVPNEVQMDNISRIQDPDSSEFINQNEEYTCNYLKVIIVDRVAETEVPLSLDKFPLDFQVSDIIDISLKISQKKLLRPIASVQLGKAVKKQLNTRLTVKDLRDQYPSPLQIVIEEFQ